MTILSQMNATTIDYFMADGKKAFDNYFLSSFTLNYFLKEKKGVFINPGGGLNIRVPLRYDGNEAGFYSRGDTISSDKKEAITAVYFPWKHAYGNGTILRVDTLENAGAEAFVNLMTEELYGAQESLTQLLANSLFDDADGSTERLTGLRALCNETATLEYGNVAENDMVAADGTKPWEGKTTSTATTVTLNVIRTLRSAADYGTGKQDEPDLGITTKTIYNIIKDILQVQQLFTTEGSKPVKAGFTGLHFEGMDIYPERYCPSGHFFGINSNHFGAAIHQKGNFVPTKWSVIEGSPEDKTMKILFDGNLICNNRRAHHCYSALS